MKQQENIFSTTADNLESTEKEHIICWWYDSFCLKGVSILNHKSSQVLAANSALEASFKETWNLVVLYLLHCL